MNNFRIKDFMNWKVALFVFMVCISIWVGTSMRTESSFLETVGGRNAANQKLMIVDQGTGEISFIQKSLQGVNDQIVADDSVILKKIEDLEKWNGDRSLEIQTLQNHMKTILGNDYSGTASGLTSSLADLTKHSENDGILGRLRKRVEDIDAYYYELAGVTLYHGNRIYIYARNNNQNHYLIDDGCDNLYGNNDKAAWCVDQAFNAMHISKVDYGRRMADS